MRSHHIIGLVALSLALGTGACKKNKDKGTNTPGGSAAAAAALDPTKATEEAKKDFSAVAERYASAKAKGSLSKAQCDQFSKEFEKVYRDHGKQMTVAYFNAGAVWDECGDVDKAEEIYQAVTKAVPNYDLSYNNLGVIYWNRNQEEKALSYFQKAVDANIATRAPRNNLAAALRNKYANSPDQKLFEDAEKTLQRVLAVDSSNQLAYENLARLYYDRGRLKDPSYLVLANLVVTQALRVLEKEGTQSADIWNLKGLLFMQDDNQVDALKAFKQAVAVEPNHADANRNIGFIAIRFRDYTTAEKSFETALKTEAVKRDIEVYIAMGVAKRGLKKFKEAEEWYRKAAELDKKDPRPWYNLAVLNQDHLIGQDDVDQPQIESFYKVAKEHCQKFNKMAEGNKTYTAAVKDCVDRIAIIDDTFETFRVMAELEAKAKELAELERKQEEERRKQLLELEKQAAAAGQRSPEEIADEQAKAEAEAAKAAEKAEEERKAKEQAERDAKE